jgi:TPR repeat protein
MRNLFFILLLSLSSHVLASKEDAKTALATGNYPKAMELLAPLADAGDARASVTIGDLYYEGKPGIAQNHDKAYAWYQKAFVQIDGEAWNNIGVMLRDGKGVTPNRKIAYLIFLVSHKESLGTLDTQAKASANLQREMAEQKKEDLQQALCYSFDYLMEYVRSKGAIQGTPDRFKPSPRNPRFVDARFWTRAERDSMKSICKS